MVPSKYQQAIYDAILHTDKNVLVRATAGSGKTTTIVEASKLIDPKKESLFAAFGKGIVEELSSRLPKHVVCSTLHSLGMSALMSHFRTSFKLNEFKSFPFIKEVLKKKPQIEVKDELEKKALIKQQMNYRFQMRDALDLVRMTMTELNKEALFQMCMYYAVDLLETEMEDIISVMKKLEIYNRSFSKKHCYLDYVDMIFLPVSNPKIKVPQFDFLFIDECQDLNLAQQQLLNRLVKSKGRMITVGDDRQAIYSFAGASIDSFRKFEQKPNTIVLPLSISYRLPLSGVALAKQVYPEIEPNPTNIEGEIRFGSPNEITAGDIVLCRNNRPLVKLYFDLLANALAPVLVGSDIQVGLEALVSKVIKKSVDEGLAIIYERLDKVGEELKAKGVKNIKENPKYENLRDKIKTVEIISNRFDHMKDVYREIGELFKEKENCIKLMTIHKSKGLEADRVFYIERFEGKRLLPSPYAVQEWESIQETNLKFVMLTRHKKSLIFIPNLES
jgi:DNA helicase-2/ATP-dependent DNA helicase PcrA